MRTAGAAFYGGSDPFFQYLCFIYPLYLTTAEL